MKLLVIKNNIKENCVSDLSNSSEYGLTYLINKFNYKINSQDFLI